MAKLLLNVRSGQPLALDLLPGVSRVGRNSANDIQVEHASISSFHCEINSAGDLIKIKDLGSTNGTFIEGRPIQEAPLAHGQRLQLGSVEMILDAPAAAQVPIPIATGRPASPVVSSPEKRPVSLRVAADPPAGTPQIATAARPKPAG